MRLPNARSARALTACAVGACLTLGVLPAVSATAAPAPGNGSGQIGLARRSAAQLIGGEQQDLLNLAHSIPAKLDAATGATLASALLAEASVLGTELLQVALASTVSDVMTQLDTAMLTDALGDEQAEILLKVAPLRSQLDGARNSVAALGSSATAADARRQLGTASAALDDAVNRVLTLDTVPARAALIAAARGADHSVTVARAALTTARADVRQAAEIRPANR